MSQMIVPQSPFVVPPMLVRTPGVDFWGYSPIGITIDALGLAYSSDVFGGSPTGTFQLWADGADVGGPEVLANLATRLVTLDTPLVVPAVDASNIDGAARFATKVTTDSDQASVVYRYQPTDPADVGKQVMGFGHSDFAKVARVGQFQPLVLIGPFASTFGNSQPFQMPDELTKPVTVPGYPQPPAAMPMARPGVIQDVRLLVRDPSGPGGVYQIAVRVDGVTAATITTANTAQRVWPLDASVTAIPYTDGQHVTFELVSAAGDLDADLVWTMKTLPGGGGGRGWMSGPFGSGTENV